MSDLPVLALEDDEDGFPRKLQQPPEPFPARQVGGRRVLLQPLSSPVGTALLLPEAAVAPILLQVCDGEHHDEAPAAADVHDEVS